MFIGTAESISNAIILLEYHLTHLKEVEQLRQEKQEIDQQLRAVQETSIGSMQSFPVARRENHRGGNNGGGGGGLMSGGYAGNDMDMRSNQRGPSRGRGRGGRGGGRSDGRGGGGADGGNSRYSCEFDEDEDDEGFWMQSDLVFGIVFGGQSGYNFVHVGATDNRRDGSVDDYNSRGNYNNNYQGDRQNGPRGNGGSTASSTGTGGGGGGGGGYRNANSGGAVGGTPRGRPGNESRSKHNSQPAHPGDWAANSGNAVSHGGQPDKTTAVVAAANNSNESSATASRPSIDRDSNSSSTEGGGAGGAAGTGSSNNRRRRKARNNNVSALASKLYILH